MSFVKSSSRSAGWASTLQINHCCKQSDYCACAAFMMCYHNPRRLIPRMKTFECPLATLSPREYFYSRLTPRSCHTDESGVLIKGSTCDTLRPPAHFPLFRGHKGSVEGDYQSGGAVWCPRDDGTAIWAFTEVKHKRHQRQNQKKICPFCSIKVKVFNCKYSGVKIKT